MGNKPSSTDPLFIVSESKDPSPPPPETIYYTPQRRLQKVQDTYDGALQQSRFQFQSPIHF